jgi:hypothetical protein
MIIASDRRQAKVIFGYVRGLLQSVPMLAQTIEAETAESITLSNRCVIEIRTASWKSTRGFTVVAALLDEIAFWPTDEYAADPDTEVINALKPAMATIPNAMMICASSPYARKGALWQAYKKHFGKDSKVLFWQSETRQMNPTVKQSLIDAALADDAPRGQSEWLARFRSDIEAFVSRESVELCISLDVKERPPVKDTKYFGAIDPSGGSSDSMSLCIGHRDGDCAVIDCIREVRPPFSPESVVREFSTLLKSYHVAQVTSDRYGAEWVRERFKTHGIEVKPAGEAKSDFYSNLLPIINSRRIDLLDIDRAANQLCSLERRSGRSGRDSIDHPPGQHDDIANVIALVASLVLKEPRPMLATLGLGGKLFNEHGQINIDPPPSVVPPTPNIELPEHIQRRVEELKKQAVNKPVPHMFFGKCFGGGR